MLGFCGCGGGGCGCGCGCGCGGCCDGLGCGCGCGCGFRNRRHASNMYQHMLKIHNKCCLVSTSIWTFKKLVQKPMTCQLIFSKRQKNSSYMSNHRANSDVFFF